MHKFIIGLVCFLFLSACTEQNDNLPNDKMVSKDSIVLTLEKINSQLKLNPSDTKLLYQRAQIFLNAGDYNSAINDIEAVIQKDSSQANYYLTAADAYFFVGKTSKTKYYLERCSVLFPDSTEGLMKLAELYLYVKQHNKSIEIINRVLKINKFFAKAYFMKGMNFKEMGDTAKAISSFQTCVEQDQEYYNAYIQLGLIFAAQKNPLAIQFYNNALNLQPKSEEAHYNMGMFFLETGQYNKAIEKFTSLVQINPSNREAIFNLGFIHFEYLKVYEQAIKYFDQAVNADPQFARGYCYRGMSYESMGNKSKAKENYSTALKLLPDYDLAAEGMNRVAN